MKKYENYERIFHFQNKLLSSLKKTNEYFTNKIESLELIISKILTSTITKGEMQTLIKKEILPIKEILLGSSEKKTTNQILQTETNVYSTSNTFFTFKATKPTNNEINNEIQTITNLEEITQSNELTSVGSIWTLIELNDGRIATGGEDGNISISSYNVNKKKWEIDIHKEKAHDNWVNSLCILNYNKLVSCSGSGMPKGDFSIKIWDISDTAITPIKVLTNHKRTVYQVIPLSNERFASCSSDRIVNIWKDNNEYELLISLKHTDQIRGLLQLKGKEMLVACAYDSSLGLTFWELNTYSKHHVLKGFGIDYPSHIIQLSDGHIALSSNKKPYPIEIIDCDSYQVKKSILLKGDVTCYSSLCLFNQYSFFYVFNGTLLQISSEDYSIMFKVKGGNFNAYSGGMIVIEGGRYVAIQNNKCVMIGKLSDK